MKRYMLLSRHSELLSSQPIFRLTCISCDCIICCYHLSDFNQTDFFYSMTLLMKLVFYIMQTKLVEVVRPCWISTLEPFSGMWHLSENGKPRGKFDTIVVAHNGNFCNLCCSLFLFVSFF